MISQAVSQLLDTIGARQRDLQDAFAPGATPQHGDASQKPHAAFVLDPLSVAAPDDTYFVTRDAGGKLLFTRDGSFAMRGGVLVDAQDRPILGYSGEGSALAPLQANPIDAALGATLDGRIAQDGSLSYERATIEPRSGRRDVHRIFVGRIALARFPAGTRLPQTDAQHFCAPTGIGPQLGVPGDGAFAAITPFARQGSAVDLDAGLDRLQEAYAALDALRAANTARGSIQKSAMDLLK